MGILTQIVLWFLCHVLLCACLLASVAFDYSAPTCDSSVNGPWAPEASLPTWYQQLELPFANAGGGYDSLAPALWQDKLYFGV